jgi:hypothetical protein
MANETTTRASPLTIGDAGAMGLPTWYGLPLKDFFLWDKMVLLMFAFTLVTVWAYMNSTQFFRRDCTYAFYS